MSYEFRPAIWEPVGLLIGLAGASGSGKTYSAMRIATGIVGKDNRFAVIDTENKRSRHYVNYFSFDVLDLAAPYRPGSYSEAIKAAIKAGYKAIIVDSMSHEHSGEGGVLEWQAENLDELVKRAKTREASTPEWKLEERLGPKSWIEPKMARKKTIQQMLFASTTIPIIVCFRAEEKLFIKKAESGRTEMVTEWAPVCGKEYPYEMTAFLMLSYNKPGYPQALKLQKQHEHLFPENQQINEESGARIAAWARDGGKKQGSESGTKPKGNGVEKKEEKEIASGETNSSSQDQNENETGQGDEKIFTEFKSRLLKCQTPSEVQQYMKEVKKEGSNMRLSEELMGRIVNLANDKLREMLKK